MCWYLSSHLSCPRNSYIILFTHLVLSLENHTLLLNSAIFCPRLCISSTPSSFLMSLNRVKSWPVINPHSCYIHKARSQPNNAVIYRTSPKIHSLQSCPPRVEPPMTTGKSCHILIRCCHHSASPHIVVVWETKETYSSKRILFPHSYIPHLQ